MTRPIGSPRVLVLDRRPRRRRRRGAGRRARRCGTDSGRPRRCRLTLPGVPAARAPQNAAPEMSPGTVSVAAVQPLAALRRRPVGRRGPRHAERRQRPLRMIPCRRPARSRPCGPSACRPASSTPLLTCALGTSGSIRDAVQRGRRRRSAAAGRRRTRSAAPIRVSGSMTRRIGRRVSEASPVMTVRNGCAGDHAGQQPHGGPGIGGVDRAAGAAKSAQAATRDVDAAGRGGVDGDAQRPEAGQGGGTIGAGRIAGDAGRAVGDARRAAHSGVRWICRRGPGRGRTPAARGGPARHRRARGASPHYSIRNLERIRFTMLSTRVRFEPADSTLRPAFRTSRAGCDLPAC